MGSSTVSYTHSWTETVKVDVKYRSNKWVNRTSYSNEVHLKHKNDEWEEHVQDNINIFGVSTQNCVAQYRPPFSKKPLGPCLGGDEWRRECTGGSNPQKYDINSDESGKCRPREVVPNYDKIHGQFTGFSASRDYSKSPYSERPIVTKIFHASIDPEDFFKNAGNHSSGFSDDQITKIAKNITTTFKIVMDPQTIDIPVEFSSIDRKRDLVGLHNLFHDKGDKKTSDFLLKTSFTSKV